MIMDTAEAMVEDIANNRAAVFTAALFSLKSPFNEEYILTEMTSDL